MPAKEQIRKWEIVEFVAKKYEEYKSIYIYILNRIPLDKEHEEWLQSNIEDTARVRGVTNLVGGSQVSANSNDGNVSTKVAQELVTPLASKGTQTALVRFMSSDSFL